MTTERQIIANRANAAKSRGPKTAEGKAVSRLNAMRHGIYSEAALVKGESEGELVAFGRRLRADLAPAGEMELVLADKIISISWRLRRVTQAESLYYSDQDSPIEAFKGYRGDNMYRISRHEAQLERMLYRALYELNRLQQERRRSGDLPPAPIDITATETDGS